MAKAARKRASGRGKGAGGIPPARAKAIRHVRWLRARLVRLRAALARRGAALVRWRQNFGGAKAKVATGRGAPDETDAPPKSDADADAEARAPRTSTPASATELPEAIPASSSTAAPAPPTGLADLRRPWATPVRPRLRGAAQVAGAAALRLTLLVGRAIRAIVRGVVDHRAGLLGLAHRALWWSALGLFLIGARGVIDPSAGSLTEVLPAFVVGFSLCAAAILLADTRRIRWAALTLGFGHGALGLLVWSVLTGS